MTTENRKNREKLLLNYFRRMYHDFPAGKLLASESPDFIVRQSKKSAVGIELTTLYPGHWNKQILSESETPEQRMISHIRQLTEAYVNEPLFVRIEFSKYPLADSHLLAAAARTAVAIRKQLSGVPAADFHTITGQDRLPAQISRVLVVRNRQSDYSAWEKAELNWDITDFQANLQALIAKKDEKLQLYMSHNLHEYWLLIVIDKLQGRRKFNTGNMIGSLNITSAFQQVFLFEIMKKNVFRLV
jgi:hypothetical protein